MNGRNPIYLCRLEFCTGLGNAGKMLVALIPRVQDLNGANLSHA